MPRRRVLQICHNHPRVRPGGAEAYAYELHLALRDSSEDWEPTFLARSGPPQSRTGRPHTETSLSPVDGAPDEYLLYPEGHDFDWMFGTMRRSKSLYTEDLRRFLLAVRPDVVHFQHTLFIGYDAIRETRRTLPHVPILHTLHEFLPICRNKGQMVRTMDDSLCTKASPRRCAECFPDISPQTFFLRKRFIQAQLDLVDLFIAPSAVVLERFVEWGIPRERMMLEEYGRLSPPVAGDGERPAPHDSLGFFGQLNPYKGMDVLLRAMKILGDESPRLRLHGANLDLQDHAFRDKIASLLDETRETVFPMGQYLPERAGGLVADVDWVVVPSIWWENSPLVIQEAFAQRRPVICSDIGGMAEKVADGVNGLHFKVGDPQSLAQAIRYAVETPGLWERLREGIPAVHSMTDHVEVLTGAYEELIERRAGEQVA